MSESRDAPPYKESVLLVDDHKTNIALPEGMFQGPCATHVQTIVGWVMVAAVAAHAAVGVKHHVVDHDETVLRMLGRPARQL